MHKVTPRCKSTTSIEHTSTSAPGALGEMEHLLASGNGSSDAVVVVVMVVVMSSPMK
jgi:hypothetical protein